MMNAESRWCKTLKSFCESKGGLAGSRTGDQNNGIIFQECISPNKVLTAILQQARLLKLVRKGSFPVGQTVLVNLTGGDRPETKSLPKAHWLQRNGQDWTPEAPRDHVTLTFWNA